MKTKTRGSSAGMVSTMEPIEAPRRARLNRDRVFRTAVALADAAGIEALSMRRLADELGVVPMALYKHVRDKDELLDGMVDVVVGEIERPVEGTDWRSAVRRRVLSARRALQRHPWASGVIESRTNPTPTLLAYMDSMIGLFLAGGFSADLTHHALHTIGSRIYGFTQEVLNDSGSVDPATQALVVAQVAAVYPHIAVMVSGVDHDRESMVGRGCDDQFEFEFALDLLLDGLERLRQQEAA